MSRIAKNSIKINKDTQCTFENGTFFAKGKLGEMKIQIKPIFNIDIKEEEVIVILSRRQIEPHDTLRKEYLVRKW